MRGSFIHVTLIEVDHFLLKNTSEVNHRLLPATGEMIIVKVSCVISGGEQTHVVVVVLLQDRLRALLSLQVDINELVLSGSSVLLAFQSAELHGVPCFHESQLHSIVHDCNLLMLP